MYYLLLALLLVSCTTRDDRIRLPEPKIKVDRKKQLRASFFKPENDQIVHWPLVSSWTIPKHGVDLFPTKIANDGELKKASLNERSLSIIVEADDLCKLRNPTHLEYFAISPVSEESISVESWNCLKKLQPTHLSMARIKDPNIDITMLKEIPLVGLLIENEKFSSDHAKHFGQLSMVQSLILDGTDVQPDVLDKIATMPNLRTLSVASTAIDEWPKVAVAHPFPKLSEVLIGSDNAKMKGVEGVTQVPALKTFRLFGDADMRVVEHLSNLKNIEYINMRFADLTPSGFEPLLKCQKLRTLLLPRTFPIKKLGMFHKLPLVNLHFSQELTQSGLKELVKNEQLTSLSLSNEIGDESIPLINRLEKLEHLYAELSTVRQVDSLKRLAMLKSLGLSNANERTLTLLGSKAKSLTSLYLQGGELTLKGVEALSNLPELRRLELQGLELEQEHAQALSKVKSLEFVRVSEASPEAKEKLEAIRPDVFFLKRAF